MRARRAGASRAAPGAVPAALEQNAARVAQRCEGKGSAPAARVQMTLPPRLCARMQRRRTRRAAVRQRPALAPQRRALRGKPGRVSARREARWPPSLRCSNGSAASRAAGAPSRAPSRTAGWRTSARVLQQRRRQPASPSCSDCLSWAAALVAGAATRARAAQTARPRSRRCRAPTKRARRAEPARSGADVPTAGLTPGFSRLVSTMRQQGPHGWSVSVSMTVTRRVSAAQSAKTASVLPSFGHATRRASAADDMARRMQPQQATSELVHT